MFNKNKNEIRFEINDRLIDHINQLKLNKERNKLIDLEIREISMKLFHFIFSQQVKLLKQTAHIEHDLELNLNKLINRENELLARLDLEDENEIRINDDDLNHLKTCFNYEFKKNEIIEKYLIIGDLLVIIFS